MDSYEIVEV